MWDVFCLEGADALKCTHCDSWKKRKKKDETLSVKLWEEREEYFSKYFLKLNKWRSWSNVQSHKASPSLLTSAVQTASCKDGTRGCGQANQIPWVNPKLADHQKSAWCPQWFRSGQRPTHTPQVSCRLPKCLAWSALCMSEKSQRDDKWLNPVRLQTPSCRMNMLSAYSYWAMCAYKLRWYHAKGEGRSLPIWLLNACVGDTGGQDSWFGTDLFTYASSFVQVTHFFGKLFLSLLWNFLLSCVTEEHCHESSKTTSWVSLLSPP